MANEISIAKGNDYLHMVIDQHLYDLTFVQQEFIQKNIDKFTLMELTREVFKDKSLMERSGEYDIIRRYVSKVKRAVPRVQFSPSQIEFIENNAAEMKAFELAKNIFPDREITKLSAETQTVAAYLKATGLTTIDSSQNDEAYKAPKAPASIVKKINMADTNANFDANDLSSFQRKCVEALKGYFSSIRFGAFMKIYEDRDIRDIFEEEFVKSVYDKPDLNSEELNMYINLCTEYVNIHQITKKKALLESKINSTLTDDDEEGKKLYMSWVDLAQKYETDLNNTKKRAEATAKILSGTRANRIEKQALVNESLAKFVEAWKDEEQRKRACKIADARKELVENEIDRLENLDEYIASVMGISKDEILRN